MKQEGIAQVEVVRGDLFDSNADILVVPCSTSGGMTSAVKKRLQELGVTLATNRGLEPGEVVAAATRSEKLERTVLFAAAVPDGSTTTADIVESAARQVGRYAADVGRSTAFPLLGTGAGGLSPDAALAAITAGYQSTAHPDSVAEVYVFDESLFDKLEHDPPAPPSTMSPTVSRAVSALESRGELPAVVLVEEILRTHSEYGGNTAGSVRMTIATDATQKDVHQWLADVRALFDPVRAPTLHGRLVIIGLTMLDQALGAALDLDGFLQRLSREVREPIETLLLSARPVSDETVPTHTDNPALIDELGRQSFARVLARRIRDARMEEAKNATDGLKARARLDGSAGKVSAEQRGGAFLVHLHAPWGAGKTSLLNFLTEALHRTDRDDDRPWVVVNFNAWRHQRIAPPWWWLMTTMYREAVRELRRLHKGRAIYVWAREYFWRFKGGWPGIVALLIVAAGLVLLWQTGFLGSLRRTDSISLETIPAVIVAAATVTASAVTLWGVVRGFGRWVFAASARGARQLLDNTNDPMRLVHEHVDDLTRWVGHDIAVMIDDLDRCKAPYVVELLEGIQTLFRDVPVTFVVAADRDWLSDSYATEYGSFVNVSKQPGQPVGYLFLEKTFQISVGLPAAGNRIGTFWERLLRSANVSDVPSLEEARTQAKADLGGMRSADAAQTVDREPGKTPAEIQARREAVAIEMVSERAQRDHVHTLAPFRALLGRDPNPRAMKRLVNAYGITRGAEILAGRNLTADHQKEQETALWTILEMRWPRLASYLAKHPEDVGAIGAGGSLSDVPKDLRPLFGDREVVDLVQGKAAGVDAKLDADTLQTIVG